MPARLLAQHAGRLAAVVELDDPAGYLQVAVGAGERRRVEPDRVRVAGHQRHRPVGDDLVEGFLRRLDGRRPVRAAPAAAAQPPGRPPCVHWQRLAHARECLLERARVLEPHLVLRDRPGREVHVGVAEPGNGAAAAEVDALRAGQRGLVRPDPAGNPLAADCQAAHDRQRRLQGPNHAVLEDHG